jgi:hypothetical protein
MAAAAVTADFRQNDPEMIMQAYRDFRFKIRQSGLIFPQLQI